MNQRCIRGCISESELGVLEGVSAGVHRGTCTPGGMEHDSNLMGASELTPGEMGCLSVVIMLPYCEGGGGGSRVCIRGV